MTKLISAIVLPLAFVCEASAQESTEDVLMVNLRGVGALDVDQILATYDDDTTLITPTKIYSGRDAIRDFYEEFVQEFSQPDITMNSDGMNISGNTALLIWSGESPRNNHEYAAETYIVESGKIVRHSFAGKITPKQ